MRILVTGGAGFIGSHLCEALLSQGNDVLALDDLSTGSLDNLAAFTASPRFRFVRHDVAVPYTFEVDRIYNLASPASPVFYQADPIRTMRTNVWGTMHALELAERTGARLLQASTSEVYGDPDLSPQPESYWGHVNPVGPRACYDEGKRASETLCAEFAARRGARVRIARIFNTYGPRMAKNDGRVVSNFVRQALEGEPLTLYGDGEQSRSFCYVDDLVAGLVLLMEHPHVEGPVNLGNPEEVTMRKLAELVLEVAKSSSPIVFRPLPVDDPRQRCPDITKARSTLGFAPTIPLARGLERMVEAFAGSMRTPTLLESGVHRLPHREEARLADGPAAPRTMSSQRPTLHRRLARHAR